MAAGRTRTSWRKGDGHPGKPKGAKDKLPRSGRACIRMLLEKYGSDEALLSQALSGGLEAKAPINFPYLKLLIEQHAGAPEQALSVTTKVVHEYHEAPPAR